jgi:membrane-bound lytic murein transglycosylase B
LLLAIGMGAAGICVVSSPALAIDVHRDDVKSFINEISEKDSIGKHRLRKLLSAAKSQPAIIEAMDRPAEKAKPWFEYRPIFVTERRIREGTEFWIAHRQELDQASVNSGVAPEYLAAIVGVETYYGRMTGSYRVLDALTTLAFDYPARAKFFRDELEQFILLTRDAGLDPLTVKGSYAGAMGAPQFMPSNYRRYAVDADANGHIDLWNSWADVCASVGNYLKEHGWNAGEPVLSEAAVNADRTADLDGRKLVLADTVESLKAKGVNFDSSLPPEAPAILIAADESDGVHWRVGYNNFYVITRYNHSALYAMAVYELAAAVKQRVLLHDSAAAGTATPGATTPGTAARGVTTPNAATPSAAAPSATTPSTTMPSATTSSATTPSAAAPLSQPPRLSSQP